MIYALLLSICTAATLVGAFSIWRVTRGGTDANPERPPVTVLKPLCGADDRLEANLESFFQQRYPDFELIFGVQGSGDPAIPVVQRLRQRYSHVSSELVVHDGGRGINPKVSNLRAMLAVASHDLAVISDSNIEAPTDYLSQMVGALDGENVGMVTSLFRGVGEQTLGATLENLHLNGPVAASLAASRAAFNRPVTVGKSMLFRRRAFERLGGFASVANVLAEDYIMGRMFREAGYEVRFAPVVVSNVCATTDVGSFWRRHVRWGLIRWRLNPLSYPLELLANPIALALLAPFFGVNLVAAWVWALALIGLRDGVQWGWLRGRQGLLRATLLGPIKEALMVAAWARAPFVRHVSWRGNRVRLSAGTRLYAQAPAAVAPGLPVATR